MKKLRYVLMAICLLCTMGIFTGCDDIKVTGIQLNQQIITLALDSEGYEIASNVLVDNNKLVATALPHNAKNKTITFSISDTEKAVIQNNKIVPVAEGVTYITATTADGNFSTSATIKIVKASQKLSTVTNVKYENGKIVWDAVENANYYTIKINNAVQTTTIQTSFMEFETGIENSIQIQANSVGTAYTSSDYSEIYKFKKLSSPLNLANSDYQFTWDSVLGATGYNVYVNNQKINTELLTSTTFAVAENLLNSQNKNIFQVEAVGNTANNIFNSELTESYSVQTLLAPATVELSQGVIMFSQVAYANGYNIKIGNQVYETTETVFQIPESIQAGEWSVKVQAKAKSNFISSNYSSQLTFTKLASITGVYVENNIIKWNKVSNAGGYIIQLNGKKIDLGNTSQFILGDDYFAGEYAVQVACVGTDTNYVMSNFSQEQEFVKLETPQNLAVVNGKIRYLAVQNATSYQLSINGNNTIISQQPNQEGVIDVELEFESGNYNIKVQAIGDGETYLNSITSQPINTTKLQKASTPYLENGLIKWENVSNSAGYNVRINDEVNEFYTLDISKGIVSLDLSDKAYDAEHFTVEVQAISNAGNINSDYTAPVSFKKYATPNSIQSINGILYFSYNANAKDYVIRINKQDIPVQAKQLQVNNKDNPSLFMCDTEFNAYLSSQIPVEVYIKGNDDYIASSVSDIVNFTMAKPLQDLEITNNVLKYTKQEEGYVLISLKGETNSGEVIESKTVSTNETSFNLPKFMDLTLESGDYEFTVRSKGTSNYVLNGVYQSIKTSILNIPEGLAVKDGVIIWSPTINANSYNVNIYNANDSTFVKSLNTNKTECSLSEYTDLKTEQDYIISIQACGNGSTSITSSETTEEKQLTVNILATPEKPSVVNGTLTFATVNNAEMYGLYVDGNLIEFVSNKGEMLQEKISMGYHRVCSYAFGDSEKYLTSAKSEVFEVVKLEAPQNLKVNKDINTGKPNLYCDFPTNAVSLDISTSYNNGAYTTENFAKADYKEMFEQELNNLAEGFHTFKAKAIGDNTMYLTSEESLTCSTTVMIAPKEINLNKGIITWSQVIGVESYTLYIDYYGEDGQILKTEKTITDLINPSYTLTSEYVKGYYKVSVQCIGDQSQYITSAVSHEKDIIKLGIPKGLDTFNGEIVFDIVEGATAYNIYVDDEMCSQIPANEIIILTDEGVAGKATFELPETVTSGDHTIMIQAVGDDELYATSEAGATVQTADSSATEEIIGANIQVTKLDIVKEFRLDNGTFKWTPIEIASGYRLQVNNADINEVIKSSSYELNNTEIPAGVKEVKVKAIGRTSSDNQKILNSNYTDAISALKLEKVKDIQPTYQEDVNQSGSIVWRRIENNNGYIVTITDKNNIVTQLHTEKDTEICELVSNDIASGELKINIKAKGTSSTDNALYITGNQSDEVIFVKLPTPTNFRIEDGMLKWDLPIVNDKEQKGYSYVVSLTINEEEMLQRVGDNQAEINTDYTAGNYILKVKVQGRKTEDNVLTLNSSYTDVINAIKPEMPTNITVDNYGVVRWDNIEYAETYRVDALFKTLDDTGSDSIKEINYIDITENVHYLGASGKYEFEVYAVSKDGLYSDKSELIQFTLNGFKYGNGLDDPYKVETPEDFLLVSKYPKARFVQTKDINLSGVEVEPMFLDDEFEGNYNGAGYKLNNLSITYQSSNSLGLFTTIAQNGVVKNVKLVGANLKLGSANVQLGSGYVGAIAGINYGTVENCSVIGTVTATTISTNTTTELNVGGIVGYNQNQAQIKNCYADITLQALIANTTTITSCAVISGGIAGTNYGTVYQCYTSKESELYGNTVGGIVGYNACEIKECYNQAKVAATNITFQNIKRPAYAGGIAGFNASLTNTLIKNCYNIGNIESSNLANTVTVLYAGGITARNCATTDGKVYAKIENCYNLGNVPTKAINGITYINTDICYNDAAGYVHYAYYLKGNTGVANGERNVANVEGKENAYLKTEEFKNLLNANCGEEYAVWAQLEDGTVVLSWQ